MFDLQSEKVITLLELCMVNTHSEDGKLWTDGKK